MHKGSYTRNCTNYFFDGMINIKNFDPNQIKIDKKSYKNVITLGILLPKILAMWELIV